MYRTEWLDIIWVLDYNGYGLESLCVIISREEIERVINCMAFRGHRSLRYNHIIIEFMFYIFYGGGVAGDRLWGLFRLQG